MNDAIRPRASSRFDVLPDLLPETDATLLGSLMWSDLFQRPQIGETDEVALAARLVSHLDGALTHPVGDDDPRSQGMPHDGIVPSGFASPLGDPANVTAPRGTIPSANAARPEAEQRRSVDAPVRLEESAAPSFTPSPEGASAKHPLQRAVDAGPMELHASALAAGDAIDGPRADSPSTSVRSVEQPATHVSARADARRDADTSALRLLPPSIEGQSLTQAATTSAPATPLPPTMPTPIKPTPPAMTRVPEEAGAFEAGHSAPVSADTGSAVAPGGAEPSSSHTGDAERGEADVFAPVPVAVAPMVPKSAQADTGATIQRAVAPVELSGTEAAAVTPRIPLSNASKDTVGDDVAATPPLSMSVSGKPSHEPSAPSPNRGVTTSSADAGESAIQRASADAAARPPGEVEELIGESEVAFEPQTTRAIAMPPSTGIADGSESAATAEGSAPAPQDPGGEIAPATAVRSVGADAAPPRAIPDGLAPIAAARAADDGSAIQRMAAPAAQISAPAAAPRASLVSSTAQVTPAEATPSKATAATAPGEVATTEPATAEALPAEAATPSKATPAAATQVAVLPAPAMPADATMAAATTVEAMPANTPVMSLRSTRVGASPASEPNVVQRTAEVTASAAPLDQPPIQRFSVPRLSRTTRDVAAAITGTGIGGEMPVAAAAHRRGNVKSPTVSSLHADSAASAPQAETAEPSVSSAVSAGAAEAGAASAVPAFVAPIKAEPIFDDSAIQRAAVRAESMHAASDTRQTLPASTSNEIAYDEESVLPSSVRAAGRPLREPSAAGRSHGAAADVARADVLPIQRFPASASAPVDAGPHAMIAARQSEAHEQVDALRAAPTMAAATGVERARDDGSVVPGVAAHAESTHAPSRAPGAPLTTARNETKRDDIPAPVPTTSRQPVVLQRGLGADALIEPDAATGTMASTSESAMQRRAVSGIAQPPTFNESPSRRVPAKSPSSTGVEVPALREIPVSAAGPTGVAESPPTRQSRALVQASRPNEAPKAAATPASGEVHDTRPPLTLAERAFLRDARAHVEVAPTPSPATDARPPESERATASQAGAPAAPRAGSIAPQRPVPGQDRARFDAREAEQTLRINIGRIRVEAPASPSAPWRTPPARPKPHISLAEYSRQRGSEL